MDYSLEPVEELIQNQVSKFFFIQRYSIRLHVHKPGAHFRLDLFLFVCKQSTSCIFCFKCRICIKRILIVGEIATSGLGIDTVTRQLQMSQFRK